MSPGPILVPRLALNDIFRTWDNSKSNTALATPTNTNPTEAKLTPKEVTPRFPLSTTRTHVLTGALSCAPARAPAQASEEIEMVFCDLNQAAGASGANSFQSSRLAH